MSVITSTVALLGLALSSYLAYLRYRDTQTRVHVRAWQQGCGGPSPDPLAPIMLFAANTGRRPVTLVSASLVLEDGTHVPRPPPSQWSDYDAGANWTNASGCRGVLPCHLGEGQACMLRLQAGGLRPSEHKWGSKVANVCFRDHAGHSYIEPVNPALSED